MGLYPRLIVPVQQKNDKSVCLDFDMRTPSHFDQLSASHSKPEVDAVIEMLSLACRLGELPFQDASQKLALQIYSHLPLGQFLTHKTGAFINFPKFLWHQCRDTPRLVGVF